MEFKAADARLKVLDDASKRVTTKHVDTKSVVNPLLHINEYFESMDGQRVDCYRLDDEEEDDEYEEEDYGHVEEFEDDEDDYDDEEELGASYSSPRKRSQHAPSGHSRQPQRQMPKQPYKATDACCSTKTTAHSRWCSAKCPTRWRYDANTKKAK